MGCQECGRAGFPCQMLRQELHYTFSRGHSSADPARCEYPSKHHDTWIFTRKHVIVQGHLVVRLSLTTFQCICCYLRSAFNGSRCTYRMTEVSLWDVKFLSSRWMLEDSLTPWKSGFLLQLLQGSRAATIARYGKSWALATGQCGCCGLWVEVSPLLLSCVTVKMRVQPPLTTFAMLATGVQEFCRFCCHHVVVQLECRFLTLRTRHDTL